MHQKANYIYIYIYIYNYIQVPGLTLLTCVSVTNVPSPHNTHLLLSTQQPDQYTTIRHSLCLASILPLDTVFAWPVYYH